MRVSRLLEITTMLLQGKTISARQFAERFGVSTRTIYRDVEELSAAGVPVYMTKGKGGGISLLDTYLLDRTLLTQAETDSLLLALKTLQATQYPDVNRFLQKLEGLFRTRMPEDWVEIEFSSWGSRPNAENTFVSIRHAILARKVICFDYVDARGEPSRRQMEPMRLIFKSQAWYLWGYCLTRSDFRTFRLSRITNLEVTPETFERRNEPADQQLADPMNLTPVRLYFCPEVNFRVLDDFDRKQIVWNSDGSCLLTVDLIEDEWLYGYLLSFGHYVQVIEPEHIRSILVERMQKAIAQYCKN